MTWEEKAPIYCRNYVLNGFDEHLLLIIGVVALWLRVLSFFQYNEFLGRFLGNAKRITSAIAVPFLLYLGNLFLFAVAAEAAFREFDEYNTVPAAFKTLFYASFGQFDFDTIEKSRLGVHFGDAFLLVFLILNIGLFMSLFVAIIAVLFGVYQENDNVYVLLETLRLRP